MGGVSASLITGDDSPPPAADVAATTSTPQSSITSFDQDDLSNAVSRVSPTVVQVQTDAGSQGSGVILAPSGLIVTNQHVVRGATSVTILTADEHRVAADVVKADDRQDLAILRPQTPVGRGAELAEEPDGGLRLGEKVFAIGSPFGLQGTVTAGVVSTIGRTNDQGIPMIQIDAPINPGNSGGGLFDLRGRLVGIPTSILAPIPGNVGIGFAIPASRVAAMVERHPMSDPKETTTPMDPYDDRTGTEPALVPSPSASPRERMEAVLYELRRVVVGQDRLLDRVLVSLLARGHVLLEGVPGLAKTLTLETVARVCGGQFTRIQFTPDLVPSDVVGGQVLDRQRQLHHPARPGVRQLRARGRDQPRPRQGAVRAARGHGRGPRHHRRRDAPHARSRSSCSPPRTRSRARACTRCPRPRSTASR